MILLGFHIRYQLKYVIWKSQVSEIDPDVDRVVLIHVLSAEALDLAKVSVDRLQKLIVRYCLVTRVFNGWTKPRLDRSRAVSGQRGLVHLSLKYSVVRSDTPVWLKYSQTVNQRQSLGFSRLVDHPRARFICRQITEIELWFGKFTEFLRSLLNKWKKFEIELELWFDSPFHSMSKCTKSSTKWACWTFCAFQSSTSTNSSFNLSFNEPGPAWY